MFKKKVKNRKYRKFIIIELVKTEEMYVSDLKLLIDNVYEPMK